MGPPKIHHGKAEALIPSVAVFEDGDSKEIIRLNEVINVGS